MRVRAKLVEVEVELNGKIPPLGLDTTLQSKVRVVTLELNGGSWKTTAIGPRKVKEYRTASNELEARANHAALCAEYGP